MIITRLEGGLGNQLFQYAMGRRLALAHGVELKLDTACYRTDDSRTYLLDRFPIRATEARWRDLWQICPREAATRALLKLRPSRLAHALAEKLGSPYRLQPLQSSGDKPRSLRAGSVVRERYYHFDEEVLRCPDGAALIGYWHSEKYFKSIRPQLLAELRAAPADSELTRQITAGESVSLHVRRTDFVADARYTATSAEYCRNAIDYYRKRLRAPRFFVFTDDLPWVQENLRGLADVQVVSAERRGDAVEEFRLMSHCRHHILAASTFSWWAAWLNDQPGKMVMCPQAHLWFKDSRCQMHDLIPPEWIQVPAE